MSKWKVSIKPNPRGEVSSMWYHVTEKPKQNLCVVRNSFLKGSIIWPRLVVLGKYTIPWVFGIEMHDPSWLKFLDLNQGFGMNNALAGSCERSATRSQCTLLCHLLGNLWVVDSVQSWSGWQKTTRWAPSLVINGVKGPYKWPPKWVAGVNSPLYKRSYLLVTGFWAHLVHQALTLSWWSLGPGKKGTKTQRCHSTREPDFSLSGGAVCFCLFSFWQGKTSEIFTFQWTNKKTENPSTAHRKYIDS